MEVPILSYGRGDFSDPRSTRGKDGVVAKLLRCRIASEALRTNLPLGSFA